MCVPLHGKSCSSSLPSNIVPMPPNDEWIHLYEWFLVVAIRAQCETRTPGSVTAGTINSNQATGICWLIRRFRFYWERRQRKWQIWTSCLYECYFFSAKVIDLLVIEVVALQLGHVSFKGGHIFIGHTILDGNFEHIPCNQKFFFRCCCFTSW